MGQEGQKGDTGVRGWIEGRETSRPRADSRKEGVVGDPWEKRHFQPRLHGPKALLLHDLHNGSSSG